jgi:hypothetical protein
MELSGIRVSLLAGMIFAAAGMPTGAHATCADLVATFDKAVAAYSVDGAIRGLEAVNDDPVCGGRVDDFRGRLVDFLVAYAGAADLAAADREKAQSIAERTLTTGGGNWRGAEKLADYFMRRGDRLSAYEWYQKSVSIRNAPGIRASLDERSALLTRLAAAQSLANDDQEGRKRIAFTPVMRESDGRPGGIYLPALLRGPGGRLSSPCRFPSTSTPTKPASRPRVRKPCRNSRRRRRRCG